MKQDKIKQDPITTFLLEQLLEITNEIRGYLDSDLNNFEASAGLIEVQERIKEALSIGEEQ